MTVDKEAILKKLFKKLPDSIELVGNEYEISAVRMVIYQAMDEYSSSLLKENEELKEALTSTEKAYEIMRDKSERLEKELLAAKNLIWKAFYLSVCDLPDDEQLKYWQEFKTENNLTEKLPQRVIEDGDWTKEKTYDLSDRTNKI